MTPAMTRCLKAIEEFDADGVSPTYQQLSDRLGYAARSRAWYLVEALAERGLVVRSGKRHRSVALAKRRDAESLPFDAMADEIINLPGAQHLTFLGVRNALTRSYARVGQ